MSTESSGREWVVEQPGLTAVALVSSLVAVAVLLPYLQFVLFGVVLAYILFPVQQRVERYVSPTLAALSVVAATAVLVLLPIIYLLNVAVRQSLGLVTAIRRGEIDLAMIEELLATNGYAVDVVAVYEANQGRIASAVQQVTSSAVDLAGSLPGLFIGLTVTLFVLFALLRDGGRLVAWVQWVLPVDDAVTEELQAGLDQLMWASVVGNVAVAAIQAALLGVGLIVAGVPAVVFLTVATFVLTLLPLVGAFGVWIPAAVYLAGTGRPTTGAALAVYGLLVTLSDTYLRPALIGRTEAFNSATVVVGIFGGLVVFGAVGLFVGPVVLGGVKLTLDCFAREHAGEPSNDGSGGRERTTEDGPVADEPAEDESTGDDPAPEPADLAKKSGADAEDTGE